MRTPLRSTTYPTTFTSSIALAQSSETAETERPVTCSPAGVLGFVVSALDPVVGTGMLGPGTTTGTCVLVVTACGDAVSRPSAEVTAYPAPASTRIASATAPTSFI